MRKTKRGVALVGREVDVAAGHREAVGLADDGHGHDLDAEFLVLDHAADDAELLGVLLAEVGAVGADDAEEAGDDGGDAAEVAGAGRAFEAFGEGACHLDPVVEAGRVHFVGRGMKTGHPIACGST